jgi:hypothetical protein
VDERPRHSQQTRPQVRIGTTIRAQRDAIFPKARIDVRVNVNTTDATAGATALLLPAQNTHTLQDPKRDTEHARAGGVEDGLGVGGLDGGGDVGDVVCEEAAGGRAALAVSRVVGGAGEARLASEEAKDDHVRVKRTGFVRGLIEIAPWLAPWLAQSFSTCTASTQIHSGPSPRLAPLLSLHLPFCCTRV